MPLNSLRITLEEGTLRGLYQEIFKTLSEFYRGGIFYKGNPMAIDKPASWDSNPPLHTAGHQLWSGLERRARKGNIVVTMKEDTTKVVSKKTGFEPPDHHADYPVSSSFGASGRACFKHMEVGSKPGAFIYINSFPPTASAGHYAKSPATKEKLRKDEALALLTFFLECNHNSCLGGLVSREYFLRG